MSGESYGEFIERWYHLCPEKSDTEQKAAAKPEEKTEVTNITKEREASTSSDAEKATKSDGSRQQECWDRDFDGNITIQKC